MDGFGLLLGHLVGDYVLQNDWQAANKVNLTAGPEPQGFKRWLESDRSHWYTSEQLQVFREHSEALSREMIGHLACTVHCLLYTLAVWACSWSWLPWWGLLACFGLHWPIDRFRLARWWMVHVSGQQAFAEKMGPWSVIVVDNTFHLLTLYLIALAAGRS